MLAYQFDDDVVQIKSFLTTFYNILERKLPKCNTICVWSPPSAGKNFFFDVYLHYLMDYGQLGIMNKTNNFSLQEATSKRVLLWNEPNYEDAYTDTLKMLTVDDSPQVNYAENHPLKKLLDRVQELIVEMAEGEKLVS